MVQTGKPISRPEPADRWEAADFGFMLIGGHLSIGFSSPFTHQSE